MQTGCADGSNVSKAPAPIGIAASAVALRDGEAAAPREEAVDKVRRLLALIFGTTELCPDAIFAAASARSIPYDYLSIMASGPYETRAWAYRNAEVFDLMFQGRTLPDEEVVFVTDGSFINARALRCEGRDLRAVVAQHQGFVFDRDLIFLWPRSGRASVFHHEGGFAHLGW